MEDSKGDMVDLPTEVRATKYAEARFKEIEALQQAIAAPPTGPMLASQELPRHLRRRAVSHNPNRLPRRLRAKHDSISAKSDNRASNEKPKRPSRKFRRRPSNLLAEYVRRSAAGKPKWLETHIWHAKRFHMISDRWGYKIADHPNDKGARAAYRAVTNKCLMVDGSYLCCLELRAEQRDSICQGLDKILTGKYGGEGLHDDGPSETMAWLSDLKGQTVGRVTLIWRPAAAVTEASESQPKGCTLWMWIHPAFYNEAFSVIKQVFGLVSNPEPLDEPPTKKLKMADRINEAKLANRNVPFDEKISKFVTEASCSARVEAFELRDSLNRFRLVGPLTETLLSHCLQPATFSFDGDQENCAMKEKKAEDKEPDFWWQSHLPNENPSNIGLDNPKPHSVRHAVVRDPRYILPPKRHCVRAEVVKTTSCSDKAEEGEEPRVGHGVQEADFIWDSSVRDRVTCDKIPDHKVNEERSKLLVPGSPIDESPAEAKIPVMLIHQMGGDCGGVGGGWDVVLPAGWGMPFWMNFVMRGARVGGQQELRQLSLEGQQFDALLDAAPDSNAGAKEQEREESELKQLHLRMPPNKRPNFAKLGTAAPFQCPWQTLVIDWSDSQHPMPSSVTGSKYPLVKVLRQTRHPTAPFHTGSNCQGTDSKESDCLLPIKVQVLGKGTFAANSMVCWPSDSDLNLILNAGSGMEINGIALDKSDLRPEEQPQADENSAKRKQVASDHKKEKAKLRRKWKRMKEQLIRLRFNALEQQENGDVITNKPADDVTATSKQIDELKKSIKSLEELRSRKNAEYNSQKTSLLGLDDFQTVRGSTTRPVMGYLNMAGTSYRLGSKPMGLGFVSLKAHQQYVKYFNEKLGYKETGPKIQALKRHYGVNFDSLVIVLVRRPSSEHYSYALIERLIHQ